MLDFPSKALEKIKNHLLKQQKEVEDNIKEMEEDDPVNSEAIAESSEPGTDSYLAEAHTKTMVLEDKLKNEDSSIKKALLKIKNGNYGKCENCGKKIEMGRLMIMPITQYCLNCSKKLTK